MFFDARRFVQPAVWSLVRLAVRLDTGNSDTPTYLIALGPANIDVWCPYASTFRFADAADLSRAASLVVWRWRRWKLVGRGRLAGRGAACQPGGNKAD